MPVVNSTADSGCSPGPLGHDGRVDGVHVGRLRGGGRAPDGPRTWGDDDDDEVDVAPPVRPEALPMAKTCLQREPGAERPVSRRGWQAGPAPWQSPLYNASCSKNACHHDDVPPRCAARNDVAAVLTTTQPTTKCHDIAARRPTHRRPLLATAALPWATQ